MKAKDLEETAALDAPARKFLFCNAGGDEFRIRIGAGEADWFTFRDENGLVQWRIHVEEAAHLAAFIAEALQHGPDGPVDA
jgi:hypothetical protein